MTKLDNNLVIKYVGRSMHARRELNKPMLKSEAEREREYTYLYPALEMSMFISHVNKSLE